MRSPATRRQEASFQRRQAILDAAIAAFSADGFAATRLDDIAVRAGVAKGTIYLFFKDKDDLFEQVLLRAAMPVLEKVDQLASAPAMPLDTVLAKLFRLFRTEILETERREIIRLVIVEGRRFPRIARLYHREVVSKGIAIVSRIARNAHARGELASDDLARFPQLVFAPLVMAIVWDMLFSQIQPLDAKGLLAAHRRVIVGKPQLRSRKV